MVLSYIKIALRNLRRNRLIAFINIFGLGLAMSIGLMELVRTQDALSYDTFHPNPDHTYRIISAYRQKDGQSWKLASTPYPLRNALAADTTNQTVSLYPALQGPATAAGKEINLNTAFTGTNFFHIFGFTLSQGDPQTALGQPGSIILTAPTAKRFFGSANPMGKFISFGKKGQYLVTGVLSNHPKSHIDFDAYISSQDLHTDLSDNWSECRAAYTYVLTKNSAALKSQLSSLAAAANSRDRKGTLSFDIQKITNITPGPSDLYNDIGRGSSWSKILTEITITLLLLIAACFNYTNLTVARALTRAKEVGVRKINGARRYQIFVQYVVEACVTSFLSLAFAWFLFSLIIRYAPFNDGYEMVPSSFHYNIPFVVATLGFALFTGLLAGVAPAWILSAFRPLRVLKNLTTAKLFGSVGLQKTLIVFQYTLSLVVILFLAAFYRQFSFLASADRGFRRDNTLVVPLNGANKEIVSSALAAASGVNTISGLSVAFQPRYEGARGPAWIDNNQKGTITLNYIFTDHSFLPSMKIAIEAGHNFTADADSTGEHSTIINVKAAKLLGFQQPKDALGGRLWVNDSTRLTIIGVTKDFIYEGAGRPVSATAFRNKKGACNYLYIDAGSSDRTAITARDRAAITARLVAAWKQVAPTQPFTSSWLDDDIAAMDNQRATLSLLGYIAFMAMSIATLGLLGLVIYSVETRRKEVSIRKVIGASQLQLVRLLSRRFIKLLVIAGAIGLPVGYTLGFLFQMNFAQRPANNLLTAIACFSLLLAIGLITIISQTYSAAKQNPAPALKNE